MPQQVLYGHQLMHIRHLAMPEVAHGWILFAPMFEVDCRVQAATVPMHTIYSCRLSRDVWLARPPQGILGQNFQYAWYYKKSWKLVARRAPAHIAPRLCEYTIGHFKSWPTYTICAKFTCRQNNEGHHSGRFPPF
jgi:hypothetical protein